jgi:hypothetical protein
MAGTWPCAEAGVAAMAPSVAASSSMRIVRLPLEGLPMDRPIMDCPIMARPIMDRALMDLLLACCETGGDPGPPRLNGA